MPDVSPRKVRLRGHDFETMECEYCRYFQKTGFCKILETWVKETQVCDAYQGSEQFKGPIFEVDDPQAFGRGLNRLQPYKHIVKGGIDTPVGYLLMIKDTMRPKAHHFSLDMKFSNAHLSREHGWVSSEINRIIKAGKR